MPPYAIAWDTTAAANGRHTLTAVARDAAGNTTTSASVAVTVSNRSPAFLAGDQAVEPGADSDSSGTAEAFATTAAAAGTATHLSIYLDSGSTATTVAVGLYAASGAHLGALLAQGVVSAPVAGARSTVAVPATAMTAGTTYWLAVLGRGGTVRFRDRCCGGGAASETASRTSLTSLPATWSTGKTYRDGPLTAYATSR